MRIRSSFGHLSALVKPGDCWLVSKTPQLSSALKELPVIQLVNQGL